MDKIALLSQDTIDKIAAGEVVERPASVVKELVENAVDAGANAVTVEIKEGGTSLIRITDNGCGIPKDQVQSAFLRHATSKIRTVDDLLTSGTLGFRGEALSSIAAVSQVEMITKIPGSLLGVRYVIEGGVEMSMEEIGAPEGTTILVRNLFYHTPARRKFLKSPVTEAGYVSDLMERLALSHPNISFKFINNPDTKLATSGNGRMRDIIYGIYGREVTSNLVPVEMRNDSVRMDGFIGKPVISRGNRNYENYFVNGRYVRSAIIARAIEDAYKPFLMNHRYPLTVLMIDINTDLVDVNVHPTKMEVRFADQSFVYDQVYNAVKEALVHRELIPEFTIDNKRNTRTNGDKKKEELQKCEPQKGEPHRIDHANHGDNFDKNHCPERTADPVSQVDGSDKNPGLLSTAAGDANHSDSNARPSRYRYPEPFEKVRSQLLAESQSPYEPKYPENKPGTLKPVTGMIFTNADSKSAVNHLTADDSKANSPSLSGNDAKAEGSAALSENNKDQTSELPTRQSEATSAYESSADSKPIQMGFLDERLLSEQNIKQHKLIGQVFDTYWIVEFQDKMYIIDQHAAHEKVLYERFMKNMEEKKQTSQMITPPIIVSLSMQEEEMLKKHMDRFTEVGFEIEPFGGKEYSICAVPGNLYSIADRTLFLEMLDGLTDISERASDQAIREKIASMSC
ncbi:MAG: DNA mismatch repair endonuclease MutL [Lachnospiraceae bacterium]|nr:DNA mismatch repair endonuclease MutL [Lachnospiraceae bacterium]